MAITLGIDLGTTKSAVAIWRDGRPEILLNAEGETITPSVVAIDPATGNWVVGQKAKQIGMDNPHAAIYAIKRFMGRRYNEEIIQENIHRARILYEVMESRVRSGAIDVVIGDTHLTPQQVSAKILQKLKDDAEEALRKQGIEETISDAVITVPAYFNDAQRQATRDAGKLAGLRVLKVLNEPTAACLAFGYNRLKEDRRTIAVYDLGGGTFDISILEVGKGPFWVRATNGNTFLGGSDLDWLIVDWIMKKMNASDREAIQQDRVSMAHLLNTAEQAKIFLSGEGVLALDIHLDRKVSPLLKGREQVLVFTREELEEIAKDWVAETLEPCARALSDAHLQLSEIQEVLLVGGQTMMPAIRLAVQDFFGSELNTSVEPREVVALGAAVQAAILTGQAKEIKLADVVPLSLGVRTHGGRMDVLINRLARVPTSEVARSYTTTSDHQDTVEVRIYQGERPMVVDNIQLGNFTIEGIELAKAGVPEIEVIFQVDDNGILHVTGRDVNSGKTKQVVISETTRLSDDQIEAILREAQENELKDAERRRQAEVVELAEAYHTRLDLLLKERRSTLDPTLAAEIQSSLDAQPANWEEHIKILEDLISRINQAGK